MQTFRLDGDYTHLYFRNPERRSDQEELVEIMRILTGSGFVIQKKIMGPDCDLFICEGNGLRFTVCATIDGYGNSVYAEDERTLECLERIFTERTK